MAGRRTARPKSLERYEALAGDRDERRTRYLLRRHLGVEPEDVPRLPWWKRRLYVEGLVWEFTEQEEERELVEATPENLGALGISVRTIQ